MPRLTLMKRAYQPAKFIVILYSLALLSLLSPGLYAENSSHTINSRINLSSDANCPRHKPTNARKHFEICKISAEYFNEVLLINARIFYGFSDTAFRALKSGVPITIQLTVEFYRERDWLWDESIAVLSQRFTIQFHTLTRKYVVTNLNSKAKSVYSTRAEAMASLSDINRLPVLDKKFIKNTKYYYARARVRLLISHLPSALRLWAYMSSDWRLKSEWYQWPL
ncbi:hypothetical protein MNBD_GAMMA12-3143 [hydrothermal vent metagenome]|uniref:DUF4390 domain-containing protein n=1 Tax=hydrothermal vent metagenome TaxID=652676 RepID=A0A3B0YWK3_9ZZZZ